MASLLTRALIHGPALLLLVACAGQPAVDEASGPQTAIATATTSSLPGGMPPRGLSGRPAVTIEALAESREVSRPTTLRDAPFAASNVLMPLHPGDEVKVTGRLQDGSWYRVATADSVGWVRPTQLAPGSGFTKVAAVEQVRLAPGQPAALPVARTVAPAKASTTPTKTATTKAVAGKSTAKTTKPAVAAKSAKAPASKVAARTAKAGSTQAAVKKPMTKPSSKETVQAPMKKPTVSRSSTAAAGSRPAAS